MNIQKLFKLYIVKRKNGQCQILIPLVELDELCGKIEMCAINSLKKQDITAPVVHENSGGPAC